MATRLISQQITYNITSTSSISKSLLNSKQRNTKSLYNIWVRNITFKTKSIQHATTEHLHLKLNFIYLTSVNFVVSCKNGDTGYLHDVYIALENLERKEIWNMTILKYITQHPTILPQYLMFKTVLGSVGIVIYLEIYSHAYQYSDK